MPAVRFTDLKDLECGLSHINRDSRKHSAKQSHMVRMIMGQKDGVRIPGAEKQAFHPGNDRRLCIIHICTDIKKNPGRLS